MEQQKEGRVFVDPLLFTSRTDRLRSGFLLVLLLGAATLFWVRWYTSHGEMSIMFPIIVTGLVVPLWGLGYYIQRVYKSVLKGEFYVKLSPEGLESMTPAGAVNVTWDEVKEVKMGLRPSRTSEPDLIIRTDKGYIKALMRMVDRDGTLPEPSLKSPGRVFCYPGGVRKTLTPGNSELVMAIKEYVSDEKFREEAFISL